MELKHKYLNVPVGLAIYVLKNKIQSPFGLYLTLKAYSEGIIKKEDLDIDQLKEILKYRSDRSVAHNLKILIDLNWVGCNSLNGSLFIRSFDNIMQLHVPDSKINTVSIFDLERTKDIDGFIYGTVIGYLSYRQKFFRYRAGRKVCRALQARNKGYYDVAVHYIARILKISNSTASIWRARAINAGYIERNISYDTIDIDESEFHLGREFAPEGNKIMRMKKPDGQMGFGFRNPDKIRLKNLILKQGKKSKHNRV